MSTRTSKKSATGTPTGPTTESTSSTRRGSKYGNSLKKGFHHGIYVCEKTGLKEYYESSYELRRFKALDASPLVKTWGRSKARIRYRVRGGKHRYHPDIFVVYHDGRVFIEEVKGFIFDKKAYFKKKLMAEWWCKRRGWTYRIIFERGLETVE